MKKLIFLLVALLAMNGAMAQWVPQNSGTTSNLNSVYFTDVNTGYVVGDSGIILKSIDGGNNWAIQSSGTFANLFSVQFTDSLTGYAVGDSSIILKTIDGGDNWVNQSVGVSADFSSISFPTVDTGYVVGFYWDWLNSDTLYNYILKTTNGGNLWTTSYLYKTTDDVGTPYVKSVFFPDVNTGYAVGTIGSMMYCPYLVKTIDGGMSWTSQTLENFLYYGILSAHFLNTDTGYVVGYGEYSSLKTINGGNDWTGLISNDFSTHYSVYFIDSEKGYLVGGQSWSNGNIIQYTEDGGNVWTTQYSDNLPGNYLLSVNFANGTTGYAVGTNGVILKTTNGGGSSSCLPEGITFNTQEQIDNFQANYPGCTEIEGDVNINGSDISNLNGLSNLTSIGGDFFIENNYTLTSLTGLENLDSIGGNLFIRSNNTLTSLMGLESLTSIWGALYIKYSNALPSLTGLENVTYIGDYLQIAFNDTLSSLTGLEGLTSLPGNLSIRRNSNLISLNGLDNLVSIGGYLNIYKNYILPNLTGLDSLTSIGGDLDIISNSALTSLTGLDNLTTIGGSLTIGCDLLGGGSSYLVRNSSLTSLTGLNSLTSIGDNLSIYGNNSLTSLTGLDNLTSIEGDLGIGLLDVHGIIGNPVLTTLFGLENIKAGSIDSLTIIGNNALSNCDVKSICNYLASPNGTIEIHDNASGCNSPDEVNAACTFSVEQIGLDDEIFIYPNPAYKTVTISGNNGKAIREIVIYNQTGQKVLQSKPLINTLDISKLRPGMYIVELVTKQGKVRKKLIVE